VSAAFAAGLLLAWLAGSLPTAYLVGKAYGVDLRTVGSGNLGATNALRTLGWKAGLLVYLVDTLKGALPVALLPRLLASAFGGAAHPHWGMAFGLAAVLGHVKPVFLRGKGGGKGVATASGVFLAMAPIPALGALLAFIGTVWTTRYVSLGSLVGAVVLTTVAGWQLGVRAPVFGLAVAVTAFVFYTHRENIARLRAGTERKLGRASSSDPASDTRVAASPRTDA
jgi:glycerol-3-phosphate acyltransferase PlsY